MRDRGAQGESHVEVCAVAIALRSEVKAHDDIGVVALWADERRGVRFATLEFGQHLLCRVAALGRVALDLPLATHLFRRVEEDYHVVELAHHG